MYDSEKDKVLDVKQGNAMHKQVYWAVGMVDENEDAEHIHIIQSQLEVIPTLLLAIILPKTIYEHDYTSASRSRSALFRKA